MKILMPALHYYPVIGGIETWTKNIAEELSKKAEIFVVTGKVKNQPKEENLNGAKIYRTALFSLTNLSSSPLIYSLSLLPFIFLKSLFLIKKEKINIIHCQGFLSSFLGFLLSKITGVPYIVTVQRLEGKGNLLKNFIYRKASACIGASWAIGKYFREIGCQNQNVEIIPNGIDLKRFENLDRQRSRQRLGLGDEFVIMTVARLEKVKGIKYLIEGLNILCSKFDVRSSKDNISNMSNISNVKLLIIGDGSERKNLENLTGKLGLTDKVKFLGQITNEKIPEYLAAADCFCLPSIKEGFGIAILEAQAAGVPAIGTTVGGIIDIFQGDINGVPVRRQDSESISNAIFRIYSDKGFAQKIVQHAKANLEKYDWQNIAEKVYEIYNRCRHLSS